MKGLILVVLFIGAGAAPSFAQQRFDAVDLLRHVRVLSADSLGGRGIGTPGGAMARAYIEKAFTRLGLMPFEGGYERPFQYDKGIEGTGHGVNVVGYLPGTAEPEAYLVLTAHYDHLGTRFGQIFNGADDNASGVAGLLALAEYFRQHPPLHSIVFAAFDGEEDGLRGAFAFVENPPVDRKQLAINLNFDMIGRSADDVLFIAGTSHYPFLHPVVKKAAQRSRLSLRLGHDGAGTFGQDWTQSSDHGAFHAADIPFLYFGVEDHADYHRPTDDFENMDPAFLIRAVESILDVCLEIDAQLGHLLPSSSH